MRRLFPALLVASLLLAGPALADGPGRGKPSESREADNSGKAPVGSFSVEAAARTVRGDFVQFSYDATGIHGFTVAGMPLFDATTPGTSERGERGAGVEAHGAEIHVDEPAFSFVAHDNPLAAARLQAEGVVVLTFTSGVVVTPTPGEPGRAAFTVGNLTGEIRGGGLQVQGQVARAHEDLLVVLNQPQGASDLHRADINHAIGKGHVGAEATFRLGDSERDVANDVVSYGNVTMTTVRAQKGNLTLQIEGHGTDGRVLVLNVDGDVVGASRRDDLAVTLDNATIPQADSLTDVLDPDNDGFSPEYYVVYDPGANAFQLLVSVPHYSVHTLSVTTPIPLPPPSVLIGITLGVLVLVPSAFVLFRRK